MSTKKETGHAKNVANFETLVTYCQGYGEDYNPGNPDIALNTLNTLKTEAVNIIFATSTSYANYKHVSNDRELSFKPVAKLFTKVFNILKASGATKEKLNDARSLINKVNGFYKEKEEDVVLNDDTIISNNTEGNSSVSTPSSDTPGKTKRAKRTVSHRSYDRILFTLRELIDLLKTEPYYNPNEAGFTIAGLESLYTSLYNRVASVNSAITELSMARINRNKNFYLNDNNICKIAGMVKSYIKAVFGSNSEQYKKVSPIQLHNFAWKHQ